MSATNRLIDETSPYLQQHADNPVNWYPWGEEALEKARHENKLILLSIGYSACHWCHVMAHESFEDPATAEVMNSLYINIKVDREERPDLDKIYQTAHHLLNRRPGGWPLNVILTPGENIPFFSGTYFPNRPAHGMPPFTEVLQRVETFYREHGDQIDAQNGSLMDSLESISKSASASGQTLDAAPLDQARRQLQADYDATYGGFGGAPKFPHPTNLERLMRHWAKTVADGQSDEQALEMTRFTLQAMGAGGMYDQIGGGFCRYSVDERWMIPHFEKMLYDNGPLLALYAQAWAATGDVAFRRIAEETAAWVMREMQSPNGGYYSTLDADSEGEEGKYYVWTPADVKALLTEEEFAVVAPLFGFDREANFEGHWHAHVYSDRNTLADQLQKTESDFDAIVDSAREKLFVAREQRVRPGRDEKILTSWNGLMIKGMAVAGRQFNKPEFISSAQHAADFLRDTLYVDNRLLATFKDDKAHLMAYLDDYVFLIDGLLELLQGQWRDKDFAWVIELADAVLEHFEDKHNGGFYFTANDHEKLIQRPKPFSDEATPAGNGVAAYVLGRLGHLLGETRYLDAAERALQCAWESMKQFPSAHSGMLLGLEEYLFPPQTIVIRGDATASSEWLQRCRGSYAPRRMCFAIPAEAELPGLLAERKPRDDVVAYVCSGMSCQAPVNSLAELEKILSVA